MTARLSIVAEPLPECPLCERPVRRETYERLGGLCSECNDSIAKTIDMLPPLTSP